MTSNTSSLQIETISTNQFVERHGVESIDQFLRVHGGALADAYTEDEPFSQEIHTPPYVGSRTSDVITLTGNNHLIAICKPNIHIVPPATLGLIPEQIRSQIIDQGINLTCLSFGPLIVANEAKGQGIGTRLLWEAFTTYFPKVLLDIRSNPSKFITPLDGQDLDKVTISAENPLLVLESEHPWLLNTMKRLALTSDIFTETMPALQAALTNALLGPMLNGKVTMGNGRIAFGLQLITRGDDYSTCLKRFYGSAFNQVFFEEIKRMLRRRSFSHNTVDETGELTFQIATKTPEERRRVMNAFTRLNRKFGNKINTADEVVYRNVLCKV